MHPASSADQPRLRRSAWVDAGYAVLVKEGAPAIRVAVLAESLGVTKGSFYWHFKSRDELLDAILDRWVEACHRDIQSAVGHQAVTPRQKLLWLWKVSLSGRPDTPGARLETALKNWSMTDAKVGRLLAEVQERRIECLAGIYEQMGVDKPSSLALLWYSYVVGFNSSRQVNDALVGDDEEIMRILRVRP